MKILINKKIFSFLRNMCEKKNLTFALCMEYALKEGKTTGLEECLFLCPILETRLILLVRNHRNVRREGVSSYVNVGVGGIYLFYDFLGYAAVGGGRYSDFGGGISAREDEQDYDKD